MTKHSQAFDPFNGNQKNSFEEAPKFEQAKSSSKSNDDEYIDFEEVK
jgi:hypothetical protein